MTTHRSSSLVAIAALALTLLLPTAAYADDATEVDVPTAPDTLTAEQMEALDDGGLDLEIAGPDTTPPQGRPSERAASSRCLFTAGIMWSRASGSGYASGTVGSKPKLHSCTSDVRKTGINSDVYRWNGWGWNKVAGTFNSYGTGNMQQKSVQYICKGKSSQSYKVVTTAWGTNNKGWTAVHQGSTPVFKHTCG
ncbi:hypothetical protein [Pseudoclavibacter helvolus]|uniref:hypothetical protein n=1 Tax=Pseudoclavibacter helvolus TaxID=255205 RepID=UPI000A9007C2|nr:hypothetical protein [Pseudoclavibacter helvolus]